MAFFPMTARATVWYVKSDGTGSGSSWSNAASNLQSIINGATSGDEVWVVEGTYTPGSSRSDSFSLKSGVSVYGGFEGDEMSRSERDPKTNVTTLSGDIGEVGPNCATPGDEECDNCYTVVKAGSGVGSSTVLDGFTITGGYADGGTLATGTGGGFRASAGGSPTIANCTFTANYGGAGGGAYATGTSTKPVFDRCRFLVNTATNGGGIAAVVSAKPMILNSEFNGNEATGDGGGAHFDTVGSAAITNCTFHANAAGSDGGGLYLESSNLTVTNSIFWDNADAGSDVQAAQVYRSSSTPTVTYSIIEGCAGTSGGLCNGAVYNSASDPKFLAPLGKDGVAGTEDDDLRLSIASPAIDACNNDADIDDATAGTQALKDSAYTIDFGGNSRFANEVFKSDSGAPGSDAPYCDIGAHEREDQTIFVDATNSGCATGCDGKTWGNAKRYLQDGFDLLGTEAMTLIVANGTYYPDEGATPTGNERGESFVVPNGAEAYGHFTGSESSLADRNISDLDNADRLTTLSGDITQNDASCSSGTCVSTCGGTWMSNAGFCSRRDNDEDNSYHVVLFKEPGMKALLDGFTIKGGMADFPENDIPGECNHESDDKDDWNYPCEDDEDCTEGSTCDVRRNVRGAGIEIHQFGKGVCAGAHHIACDGETPCPSGPEDCEYSEEHMESRVTVRNCTIKENSAVNHGGGVDDHGRNSVFENCRFINNYAGRQSGSPATAATDGRGGAFYTAHGAPVLQDCAFDNNAAGDAEKRGGAFYADHESSATVRECEFSENEAGEGGAVYGGFNGNEGLISVEYCRFEANLAAANGGGGGAIWLQSPADGTAIRRTVFDGNIADTEVSQGGGALYFDVSGEFRPSGIIEECQFLRNESDFYGGAVFARSPTDDFLIINCVFVDNEGLPGGAIAVLDDEDSAESYAVIDSNFIRNISEGGIFNLGGAFFTTYGGCEFVGCKFIGNRSGAGGAVYHLGADEPGTKVVNGLFAGNSAGDGGAIHVAGAAAYAALHNCTVADNSASNVGGGAYLVHLSGTSEMILRNSIFWNNTVDNVAAELSQANSSSAPLPDIEYSIVEDCSTGSGGYCNVPEDENLDVGTDPLFPDPTTGTWEVNGGTDDTVSYNADLHQTTFTDYSASFGSLAGLVLKPNHTDHADVYTLIVSNTSTTITVWGDFSSGYLVNGKTYQIRDYRLDECSPAIDSGNDASGYLGRDVWDLDGDSSASEAVPYDLAGNAREYNDTGYGDTGDDTGGNVSSAINDRGAYERQTNSSECE